MPMLYIGLQVNLNEQWPKENRKGYTVYGI